MYIPSFGGNLQSFGVAPAAATNTTASTAATAGWNTNTGDINSLLSLSSSMNSLAAPVTSSTPSATGMDASTSMLLGQINSQMAGPVTGALQALAQVSQNLINKAQNGGTTTASATGDSTLPASTGQLNSSVPEGIRKYSSQIMAAAKKYGVPPEMIAAVMTQESGGNPTADSGKAKGLMQFTPSTWAAVTKKNGIKGDITDPTANIQAGAAYLKELYGQYGNDWKKALAAYNGGPRGVTNPAAETKKYVPAVLAYYQKYTSGSSAA